MIQISQCCNDLLYIRFCVWNARVLIFWDYLPEFFVLKVLLCLVRLPHYHSGFVSLRLVNSKRGTLSLFMLEYKIHGVSQDTRPMTCVLGLEGIALE
jgi:hypothetical protein